MRALFLLILLVAFSVCASAQTATVRLAWRINGATQSEADQKLARHLAPFVESQGFADLCLKNADGTCQKDAQGDLLYDLARVAERFEEVIRAKVDASAKERFVSQELEKARQKAEADAEKRDKPQKTASAPPG